MFRISIERMNALIGLTEGVWEESCGLFLGRYVDENTVEVENFIPLANSADKDRYYFYLINKDDYMRAERIASHMKLEIVGVYHTHLNHPAILSETDKRFAFPGFFYLIMSMMDLKYQNSTCWRTSEEGIFTEEEIVFYN